MSLDIIVGKPGSGKSYHCVGMLMKQMQDWFAYEKKNGKPFERRLYTNLPLSIEGINEYLSETLEFNVDATEKITFINDKYMDQLRIDVQRRNDLDFKEKFPFAAIPNGALIVIDEVQLLFGDEMDSGPVNNFHTGFKNYLSKHRHFNHDHYFITQDTANISTLIITMAEHLHQIINLKSQVFGFPFNIPMADIDVVKEAFGVKRQLYRVSMGTYVGRRVKWNGHATTHVMDPRIFKCYKSHTKSEIADDRPSLKLSPHAAAWWFIKKHGWHLFTKVAVAIGGGYLALHLLGNMPGIMADAVKTSVPVPASEDLPPSPAPVPKITAQHPVSQSVPRPIPAAHGPTCSCGHDHGTPAPNPVSLEDETITAVFRFGVLTNRGRRKVGDKIRVDGKEEVLKATNVVEGLILFESGKEFSILK